MQRRNLVAAVLVLIVVVLAGSWFGFSGRDGLTPVEPASTQAEDISDLYVFIGIFAAAIFLSVAITLALIVARYRERGLPREVEGPQVRGNTRLEVGWTLASLVIVIVIVAFSLVVGGNLNNPEGRAAAATGGGSTDTASLTVLTEGRQFYWRYVYENGAIAIDRLRIPVGRTVDLEITAPDTDVIHSWWAPALGGKMDAIPGVTNHLQITPTKTGIFDGRCAELCGIQHTAMDLSVEVMEVEEFEEWLEREAGRESELGNALFEGVCSKCHFAAPEYAPNIIGNPILQDEEQLRQLVENGRGRMPAVGRDWTDREHEALFEYFSGGGAGGGGEEGEEDDDGS